MSTSTCPPPSSSGVLSQSFPESDTLSDSFYSCAFPAASIPLAQPCCGETPHLFAADPCYAYCDLPADMNAAFDAATSKTGTRAFDYMKQCLNSTGEPVGALWCHAQPHIVRPTATTTTQRATSTFDAAAYCATLDMRPLLSRVDPAPGCAVRPQERYADNLLACCQPGYGRWGSGRCYEWCPAPRGTGYHGMGNLSYEAAMGSFRACMLEKGNGSLDVFEGVWCRFNGSEVDLRTSFAGMEYLTGSAGRVGVEGVGWGLVVLAAWAVGWLGR
ncbi:hypothetical protein EJ06DRAFT_585573 [Trichodelitschia bisporula]|uniref:Uncharacterized protein n=1 Tax=Trichodelitschia bisporula TaxID=703511 RepID=A0A6G1HJ12_9PEZI|nr:hypothetical protein EJ06DRAFT_585573 [Trichodelitschia bisporula]